MSRPIHPQALHGQAAAVRWVTPTGSIPIGEAVDAPGRLGALLSAGVLTRMCLERDAVVTWLANGRDWADDGATVRHAVATAVEQPGWQVRPADDLLELIAQDVLAGELADYIASHGGRITLIQAADDVVLLNFGGACRDCPAAGSTLHERIETSIRRRYPALREVRRPEPTRRSRGWLGLPRLVH